MLKTFMFLLISFLFLTSCNKSEESSVPVIPEEENDITKPSIRVTNDLEGVMEEVTQITFVITDNSENVTTTVRIDDIQVFSTKDKEFSIQIDPFDFLNGEHVLNIESLDEANNKGELTESIQLQKLLFVYPDIQILSFLQSETLEYYLLINMIDGNLIESRKIESVVENRFYAPDGFEKQNFTVTLFGMPKNESVLNGYAVSYSDLSPGSVSLSSGQLEVRSIPNIEKDVEFDLSLTNVQEIINIELFGREYLNGPFYFESDTYSSSVSLSSSTVGPLLMYYSENKNDLDDYRYYFLNEYSDTTVSFNDFNSVASTVGVSSLSNIDNFTFGLRGYKSQVAYENDKFNEVYTNSFEGFELNVFQVPQFDVYEIYTQSFGADLDEKTKFLSTTRGLGPVSVPDWSASLSGDKVLTSGDYDVFQMIANFRLPTTAGTFVFDWNYFMRNNPEFNVPFTNFEIPLEIQEKFDTIGLNVKDFNSAENLRFSMEDFEIPVHMEEGAFTGFRRLNRNKDYKSISIIVK
ncbi:MULTISPECIES: hypothetical protein [Maribacter]|uniref:Uncharacterized protein n=1 Tax=Maribacter flavus TaxID=1658664 RepID=A0ABU7IGS0_9FLAO|nr:MULTISPECIES: hypothetical protein [Maribacter]MDC6404712.1 hypothetical protein [Maribacter sp. PR66]MEE1972126.1 hypothetical protein [Maribacter flavus]